jgi:hypothetical protein
MRALGLAAVLAISATVSDCAWAAHHDVGRNAESII